MYAVVISWKIFAGRILRILDDDNNPERKRRKKKRDISAEISPTYSSPVGRDALDNCSS